VLRTRSLPSLYELRLSILDTITLYIACVRAGARPIAINTQIKNVFLLAPQGIWETLYKIRVNSDRDQRERVTSDTNYSDVYDLLMPESLIILYKLAL